MTTHDSNRKVSPHALIEQISPEFANLTADISDVMKASNEPMLVAALLYKLAQERKHTNELMEKLYQKYDELSFAVKTNNLAPVETAAPSHITLLPDADQKIMALVEEHGNVDAARVQKELGYKNTNAASQRLNMLVKSGHLGKLQSGKKVVFLKK